MRAWWRSAGVKSRSASVEEVRSAQRTFKEFEQAIDEEWPARLEAARLTGAGPRERGATWTYLTTDEPFGHLTERIMRGLKRMVRS